MSSSAGELFTHIVGSTKMWKQGKAQVVFKETHCRLGKKGGFREKIIMKKK